MRRSIISLSLVVCGVLMMMLGIMPGAGAALAGPAQQEPSPRPPLDSTVVPTPDRSIPTATPTFRGRITGTVIDLTTGLPTPGVTVRVGDGAAITDANGNYERVNLAPGGYVIELALGDRPGTPEQGPVTVNLAPNGLVIQHLFFRSAPAAPATAVVVPTATLEPVVVEPPPVAIEPPPVAVEPLPVQLPITAAPDQGVSPLVWLLLGAALVALGGMVQLQSVLRRNPAPVARSQRRADRNDASHDV